jgi:flagellar hook-associated protein 1 FlgK
MLLAQRDSVSGVSVDEEMTNMMKYQKAFEASARLVTTVSEMLDSVINLKR